MKKQLLFLITLSISILGFSQTVGDTFVDNYITYQITSLSPNTVQTTNYDMTGGTAVTIPNYVNYNSATYSVTAVGYSSFTSNNLTSVVFTSPSNIITIDNSAFSNNNLGTITIPNGVTSIGDNAFNNNQNLTSVTIPNSVLSIGGSAFLFNDLSSIIIPDSVLTIGDGAFAQNTNMTNVVIGNNVTSIGEFAFRFNSSITSIVIPDSVTNIGLRAFESCYMDNLVLGNGITSLNDYVFAYNNITSVNIPSTVTSIGDNAFLQNNLVDINIPDGVTTIGEFAFAGNDLINVIIPDNVINIENSAFSTNNLTSVSLGDNVATIGLGAFAYNQLSSIILPASVVTIGDLAFQNNPSLTSIISLATTPPTITTGGTVDSFNSDRSNINLVITNNTTDEYVTDSGALWTGFQMVFEATSPTTVEVSNYDPVNGTSVVIPANVTADSIVFDVVKINDSVFENIGLTSVTIPDSVTEIGISAFELNNLTSVTIPDSVTLIHTTAFAQNSISNLSLGANVNNIGIGAFVDNSLSDVTIPSNVTFIGLLAFGNNPLTDVTSLATTPPTITTGTNDTFAFNRSNIHLHIPAGTMGAYVTDAGALWTGFNPVTEDALSTNDYELANDIKIITTTDGIEIVASNNARLENYSVYNISGAKVTSGQTNRIATDMFSSGIYILKLDFDRGTITKKVIIN